MIDHVILTVSDFKRSVAFYAEALKPLGITTHIDYRGKDGHPDLKGFGDGKRHFFWLKEGKPRSSGRSRRICSERPFRSRRILQGPLAAGGKSRKSPQSRLEYYPGYYATWVLDPAFTMRLMRYSPRGSRYGRPPARKTLPNGSDPVLPLRPTVSRKVAHPTTC
jgi:catechol 2,3-dioxygenase-like lactoylglutathione lyase family enzyme